MVDWDINIARAFRHKGFFVSNRYSFSSPKLSKRAPIVAERETAKTNAVLINVLHMEKQGSPCFSPHGNTQKMNEEHEKMNEERGKSTLLRVIPTMAFQTCCVLLNSYQVSLG